MKMQVLQAIVPEYRFQIAPNWPEIGKMTMTSQFADMTSLSNVFDVVVSFFVKFTYWSQFHVNIIPGCGVMTIFFYKRMTRNPKIGNNPV